MSWQAYMVPGSRSYLAVVEHTVTLVQDIKGDILICEFEEREFLRERTIPKITPEKVASLREACVVEGEGVPQCFYFAAKHSPRLLARVVGYSLRFPGVRGKKVAVVLYEKAVTEAVDMVESSTPGRMLIGDGDA